MPQAWTSERLSLEAYITHNGDLDFYEWHGVVYPITDVFIILERVLHVKPPATVDSQVTWGDRWTTFHKHTCSFIPPDVPTPCP